MAARRTIPYDLLFVPALDDWPDAGVYQLRMRVHRGLLIRVGVLGTVSFPAGVYVYTGRAARGLRARVLRHTRGAGKPHWHIDYLLAHDQLELLRILLAGDDPATECAVNQAAAATALDVIPGFGASDCRSACRGHICRIE